MDEAIKDLVKQELRARGLGLPEPRRAVQATLWMLAQFAQTCEVVDYPLSSFSMRELEEEIADTIRSLMILAILYDLSPLENLVKRANRRITDA